MAKKNTQKNKKGNKNQFKKPSAYKSGAVVRCRRGKIWKGIK